MMLHFYNFFFIIFGFSFVILIDFFLKVEKFLFHYVFFTYFNVSLKKKKILKVRKIQVSSRKCFVYFLIRFITIFNIV